MAKKRGIGRGRGISGWVGCNPAPRFGVRIEALVITHEVSNDPPYTPPPLVEPGTSAKYSRPQTQFEAARNVAAIAMLGGTL